MNGKPNIPEEIGWGKQYSWRASLKAGGGWMMLAFLTDLPGIYLMSITETGASRCGRR